MTSVIEHKTREPGRFLRLPEVMARTGRSRSTIYVRPDQGGFPRPVSLGARSGGSRRRWTNGCASESLRAEATRGEDIPGLASRFEGGH